MANSVKVLTGDCDNNGQPELARLALKTVRRTSRHFYDNLTGGQQWDKLVVRSGERCHNLSLYGV